METNLHVLSQEERDLIHERSLRVLANTGVRVDTALGRQILADAGAQVDRTNHIVHFPSSLVEDALLSAPKEFSLGARRPGWDLRMNAGECTLLPDGEATSVLDRETGVKRPSHYQDWLDATRITDALDEVGLYWSMVQSGRRSGSIPDMVAYWAALFANFSKHIQLSIFDHTHIPWLLEVLQVIFGNRDRIRTEHPVSCLLCPQSPLVIDQQYTDAYLATLGWDIPAAIMPMPLMGGTAPGTLLSTILQGNCEVLAMLCLLQAGSRGTPIIYAPALAVMDPYSGVYSGGAIENGLLGAAATEMGRYYGLPVLASGGGTDHQFPGIRAGFERSMNALIPLLSWPDILVGPGLLGNSMILSLEQLLIDIEIFRRSVQAHRGVRTGEQRLLDDVIEQLGPGSNYLGHKSTVAALRDGERYIARLGVPGYQKRGAASGDSFLIEEAHLRVAEILSKHQPLPMGEEIERALKSIQLRAANM